MKVYEAVFKNEDGTGIKHKNMLTEIIAFRASREDKALLFKRAKDNKTSVGNLIRSVMSNPQKTSTDKKIDYLREHLYSEFDNVIKVIQDN